MKKSIIIFASLIWLTSCGSDTESAETSSEDSAATTTTAEPAGDPEVQKGLDLIAQSDCFTCHKLNETAIGPSYAAVAEKYQSMDRQAAVDSMVHQIINGGSGKWGTTPMTPHPATSPEEATAMVAYIMSIKKE